MNKTTTKRISPNSALILEDHGQNGGSTNDNKV